MALAATHFDLVQAIDIHFQMVTTPAGPVPMPLPSPFVGMVFDPAGLLIGAAINEAMSALSGSITGPVYINGVPAATVGTEAINLLKHVHYAGSSWAPVPRLPPPPLKPGATPPDPPSPLSPSNDGPLIQGSETVTIQGISASLVTGAAVGSRR